MFSLEEIVKVHTGWMEGYLQDFGLEKEFSISKDIHHIPLQKDLSLALYRPMKAKTILQESFEHNNDKYAWNLLGKTYYAMNRPRLALSAWKRALSSFS